MPEARYTMHWWDHLRCQDCRRPASTAVLALKPVAGPDGMTASYEVVAVRCEACAKRNKEENNAKR